MQPLNTRLTKFLKCKTPIISAPMYGAASTALPLAVHRAGGFGLLPVGWDTVEQMDAHIKTIRKELHLSDDAPLPLGLGYIVCMLDAKGGVEDARLLNALANKPAALMLAFSDHIDRYVTKIRQVDANREHKTKIFVTTNSLEEALRATYEFKTDVLIIQGCEAGGHSRSYAPPLHTFLQAVLDAIPREERPIIVAAGGVFSGAQMAGLLTLGAEGVIIGSRFLCTNECIYSDVQKDIILDSGFNATVHNKILDESTLRLEWPVTMGGRNIANDYLRDYQAKDSLLERFLKIDEAEKKGEKNRQVIWAGIGIGHLKKKETAASVMQQLHEGCIETLLNPNPTFSIGGRGDSGTKL